MMTGRGKVEALKETQTAKVLLQKWTTVTKNLTTEESILEIDDMIEKILEYLARTENQD
jgi:hypothetical protein